MIKNKFNILPIILLILTLSIVAFAGSPLPDYKPQFFDSNGNPLTSGSLKLCNPGTTNVKTIYTNSGLTVPKANPVNLDSSGRAEVWLNGTYDVYLYDGQNATGNLIYTLYNISSISAAATPFTPNYIDASEYGDLTATITTLGITTPYEVWVTDQQTLTDDTTIPANITLRVIRGGIIVADGYKLTFTGPLEANPAQQIFTGFTAGTSGVSWTSGGVVYPEWWGAIAGDAIDDTVYIQDAIDSIPKGTVQFGAGNYVSDSLTGESFVNLLGNKTTITLNTAETDLFTATSKSNIILEGITFEGSDTAIDPAAAERLVYFDTCSDIRVSDCTFKKSCIGLQCHTCTDVKVTKNRFEDILRKTDGSGGYGFLANTDNDGIFFTENYGTNIERHFCYISAGSSNAVIKGNVAIDCNGTPFNFHTAGYSGQNISRNTIIEGNTVDSVSYGGTGTDELSGISVTGYFSGIIIKGNSIYNITNSGSDNAYGVYVQSSFLETYPISNVVISGNSIDTVDNRGILVMNGRNITISGNTIKNITELSAAGISASVSGTGSGSILEKVIIEENVINDPYAYGISVSGTTSNNAVVSIGNNWIHGAGTYDYNIGSYSDIKWIGDSIDFSYDYENVAQALADFTTAMSHDRGYVNFYILPFDAYIVSDWLACNATMTTGGITARMADGTGTYEDTEIILSAGSLWVTSGTFIPQPLDAGTRVYLKINSDSDLNPTTLDLMGGIRAVRRLR